MSTHTPSANDRAAGDPHLRDPWFRTLFENTGTATAIIEQDMTVSMVNPAFTQLTGYERDEIEHCQPITAFIAQVDRERIAGYHSARRASGHGVPGTYEALMVTRSGQERIMHVTVALIPGTSTSVASFIDITHHRQILNALQESEALFRGLVEHSHTGIFIVQGERIVYSNPEQRRLFGPPPADSLITNVFNIHPDDRDSVQAFHQRIVSGMAEPSTIDYRFFEIDAAGRRGGLRWVHCHAAAIEYRGQPATLVNMMDVSDTRELQNMVKVKDRMAALGHVAAGIAHEIRNPLSGIMVFLDNIAETLEEPDSGQELSTLVTKAREAANKIESVIRRVLDFVRPGPLRFELTDVNQPVRETLLLSDAALCAAQVRLETNLTDGLPQVPLDPQLIEQVLLNLVTNALEALQSRTGSRQLRVTTTTDEHDVIITVADSGPGVEESLQNKIFDPFFSTKEKGSGIGLSICQRIISDHQGVLRVDRAPDLGGAAFTIRLPIASAESS